jgi:tetratricopeptide (TPR) repeat protein
MSIRARVLEVIEFAQKEEGRLIQAVPPAARQARGKADVWTVRDTLVHQAAWNLVMVQGLEGLPESLPAEHPAEETDEINGTIFASAADWSWATCEAFLQHVWQRLRRALAGMEDATLEQVVTSAAPQGQPLWQRIVGSAVIHPTAHFALCWGDLGDSAAVLALNERAYQALEPLSAGTTWRGVLVYNLGCAYALAGDSGRAIELLKQALALRPDLIPWSRQDPDFDSLRQDPAYLALYAE